MNSSELSALVRDLRDAIEAEIPVDAYSGELSPLDVPLSYQPAVTEAEKTEKADPKPASTFSMPPNFLCQLCPDRLYPVRKYLRTGKMPVLFLFFNGSVTPGKVRPDRSDLSILASPEEDHVFQSALKLAELSVEDLFFQQYPACHFNPERGTMTDWTRRTDACKKHLLDTIHKHQIKHLLISSPSSQFLMGKTEANTRLASGEEFEINLSGVTLKANVMRRSVVDSQPDAEKEKSLQIRILSQVRQTFHV